MKTFFKKFWKEITITSIVILILGLSRHVFANETTVNYPDFIDANVTKSPAAFVSGFYTYALSISGTLAVIMIVYGGVKYTISAGNASAQSDAKSIITSSVWGVILLAGAYIILNTINPQLLNLSAFEQTASSTLGNIPSAPYSISTGSGDSDLAALALQLRNNPLVVLDNNNHCGQSPGIPGIIVPRSDPASNISDVIASTIPVVCSPDCNCVSGGNRGGGVTLTKEMLQGLVNTFNYLFSVGHKDKVRITSLTGGKHGGQRGGGHYEGRAADIIPSSNGPYEWSSYIDTLMNKGEGKGGALTAFCEYPPGTPTNCSNVITNGARNPGAHIHVYW